MLFEDTTYINNKHKLSKEKQEEMENNMDIHFHVIAKQILDWNTMKTGWERSTAMTRIQIANYLGVNIVLEIRDSYPIGFNYDINGNKM